MIFIIINIAASQCIKQQEKEGREGGGGNARVYSFIEIPLKKSKNMAQNFQHDLETGLIQSLKDDFETKI